MWAPSRRRRDSWTMPGVVYFSKGVRTERHTADRAAMHPRQFVPDGERGPPVRTDERLRRPVTGTREYARGALYPPLVPSLKLRKPRSTGRSLGGWGMI